MIAQLVDVFIYLFIWSWEAASAPRRLNWTEAISRA
jgi:hypothetical protein